MMIEQTEGELRSEISFWRDFLLQCRQDRDDAAHPRAIAALQIAEARLKLLLASSGGLAATKTEKHKHH